MNMKMGRGMDGNQGLKEDIYLCSVCRPPFLSVDRNIHLNIWACKSCFKSRDGYAGMRAPYSLYTGINTKIP